MPFGANTRTSCALFDALEVCGVSIDKQICTVFSYDAPLINLRTIRKTGVVSSDKKLM